MSLGLATELQRPELSVTEAHWFICGEAINASWDGTRWRARTGIMYSPSVSDDATKRYAEGIHRIAREHGAVRIRLFGSHATGAASSSSDVDFLVELEPGRDLLDLVALKQDLEALLGRPADIVEEGGISPYLRDRILREALPIC